MIDRAVFSYWSRPMSEKPRWYSRQMQLCSWALSVLQARKWFAEVTLVTDTVSKPWLVDGLGLPFDEVSYSLDVMPDRAHEQFIALGKLRAYGMQTKPFIHLDDDLFLFKQPEERMLNAKLCAYAIEYDQLKNSTWYAFSDFEEVMKFLPASYRAGRRLGVRQAAVNAGVLGGRETGLIREYVAEAEELLYCPENRRGWNIYRHGRYKGMAIVEQYVFWAMAATRRVPITYLLDTIRTANWKRRAEQVGVAHLIGTAKLREHTARSVAFRVQVDYPETFERIRAMCGTDCDWWEIGMAGKPLVVDFEPIIVATLNARIEFPREADSGQRVAVAE